MSDQQVCRTDPDAGSSEVQTMWRCEQHDSSEMTSLHLSGLINPVCQGCQGQAHHTSSGAKDVSVSNAEAHITHPPYVVHRCKAAAGFACSRGACLRVSVSRIIINQVFNVWSRLSTVNPRLPEISLVQLPPMYDHCVWQRSVSIPEASREWIFRWLFGPKG